MQLTRTLYMVIISTLVLPLSNQAAEWSAEPKISLRSGYNDNIRLTSLDHDPVWETAFTPAVKFGVAEQNQGLFGNASASVRRFYGGSGNESSDVLDREDYYLKTNAYHKTEQDEFTALLNYTRDSTLDSELDETGQVISSRATRTRITAGPGWSRTLNERTLLTFGYNFTNVDYTDDPGVTDLIGYDYEVLSASLVQNFTPTTQGTLASSYSRYQPDNDLDSETSSIQVGISRNLSETLTTSWLAGVRKTKSDTQVPSGYCVNADPNASFPTCLNGAAIFTGTIKDNTDDNGSVFSADITKLLETGKITASVSRASNPSSNGELLDTTRILLSGDYKFTETLRSSLSIEYSKAENIVNASSTINQTDDKVFRIRPKLFWDWRREWRFAGEYEYTESDDNNDNDNAIRNAFYVTIIYKPQKISASR